MLSKKLWLYLNPTTAVVMKVLGLIVVSRILPPHDFGVFAVANVFITIGTTITGTSMSVALIKINSNAIKLRTAWTFKLMLSMTTVAVC